MENNNNDDNLEFDQKFWSFTKRNAALISVYLICIFIALACLSPYIISVSNGQVPIILPYISDAASFLPAAGFFSETLDIIVIVGAIIVIARYKQLQYYIRNDLQQQQKNLKIDLIKFSKRLHLENFFALSSFAISGFGLMMIGNFRVREYMIMHLIGVYIYIIFSLIHIVLMIIITRKLYFNGKIESYPTSIIIILIVLIISISIVHLTNVIPTPKCSLEIFFNFTLRNQLKSDQCGFNSHLVSAIFEYIYFLSYIPYFWSIGNRMKMFKHWDQIIY